MPPKTLIEKKATTEKLPIETAKIPETAKTPETKAKRGPYKKKKAEEAPKEAIVKQEAPVEEKASVTEAKATEESEEAEDTKEPEEEKKAPGAKEDLAYVEFEIPLEEIVLGDHQPRSREGIETRGSLTQLKDSIREVGLLQPILVQKQKDGKYLLISGERRYRACQELGHKKIRAVLPSNRTIFVMRERGKTLDELALFENLQRKNLTPIEEGRCFDKLQTLLALTQDELGKRLGLKQAYVSERIVLLGLPELVQEMIEKGEISTSQARELGRLKDLPEDQREEKQIELAGQLIVEKLTVRKAKKLVDDLLGTSAKRDGAHLMRLGAKKAVYFISTLNEKFDEIDLAELQEEENREKLQQLSKNLPALIKKLQGLEKKVAKLVT